MCIRHLKIGFISCCFSLMISGAAMGDDLEIYLGSGNSSITYNPNVLFIMDTSGSMGSKDGTSQSRMLRVQNALKDTLNAATNINAGLMRFSDFGGPILYPIRPIDDYVTPEMVVSISDENDDAHEIAASVSLSGEPLVLSQGKQTLFTGLRFQNLNIPQGAVITSAFIRFTSHAFNSAETVMTIDAELSADSAAFSNTESDLSSRTLSTNTIIWDTDNGFPLAGQTVSTPELSSLVQEIVDQSDWCGGNDMSFIIRSTGATASSARQALSFEEGSGRSPQLVIKYDDSSATGCVAGTHTYQVSSQQDNSEEKSNGYDATGKELTFRSASNRYIGLRFQNLSIAQGATISSAYLIFTAYQNGSGYASFDIQASDQADAEDFSNHTRYMLRDKAKTIITPWTDIPNWQRNQSYPSPDISASIQAVIDRGDWQSGNDLMLILSNFNGRRGAYTYNGKPSGATQLVIEFAGNATPGSTSTVREHLIGKVDELAASGLTPIVDTLYEAVQYYGGLPVDYGLRRGTSSVSSTVRRNTRVSHRLSYEGGNSVLPSGCSDTNLSASACINEYIPAGASYSTPIVDQQCQTNNHIVLLSDGIANNNHSQSKIQSLLGINNCLASSQGEHCTLDLVKNVSKSADSVIDSRIVTHTIGFATGSTAASFLNKLALQSGGSFHQADNSSELINAFQSILRSVKDVNATFVSTGVAVNQLNRLTHKDELYFALFKPSEGTIWPGNLKKYKIDGDKILDKNGADTIDDGTGFFSENAHSYWSTLSDGNDVRLGGAAAKLDLVRQVYTFDSPGSIMTSSNQLHESNSNITLNDLAISTQPDASALRNELLKWARGVDVQDDDADGSITDVRLTMGDPIHSQPVIINYAEDDSAIFVATNHGFLHSFDPETGEENFAVIPKTLLSNLHDFYLNASTFSHVYGLDGHLVPRKVGDQHWLYVGMRRGGNNYYVFNVTNKTAPKLEFSIEGGSTGFEKLGQSWSKPTLTKIKIGDTSTEVMIIGGGYDEQQDDKTIRSPDSVGNAVYIVDANTGALIWSASNEGADLNLPEMQYSIPARISVIDREADGYADHMYVVDTGGQLFRIDIANGEALSDMFNSKLMADFGGETEETNRRFYYGPDVSEINLSGQPYYAVALGSGFRAHPLNETIQDQFYLIQDDGVFTLDENGNYTFPEHTILPAALYDASAHLLTSGNEEQRQIASNAFADKPGWLINLDSGGEKVLAAPFMLNYKVFFTTYVPATASTSLCAPPTGNSRAYLVDIVSGNAVTDLNKDGTLQHEDRYAQLKQTGIAPETKILIEDIVQPVVCLGTECTSAVIAIDEDGEAQECGSDFSCLAENIYGRFERVQRSSWKTETERADP
jgi:type IV pilus assembly protein PilY1